MTVAKKWNIWNFPDYYDSIDITDQGMTVLLEYIGQGHCNMIHHKLEIVFNVMYNKNHMKNENFARFFKCYADGDNKL